MKPALLLALSFLWTYSALGLNRAPSLKENEGFYELIAEESDYYCSEAPKLSLFVSGTQATIQVWELGVIPHREVISGINTSHYTETQYLGSIVRTRHVYKNGQLKAQEKTIAFIPIPSRYKDSRAVLSILGDGRIEYNFNAFGSTMCRYVRVSI